MGINYKEIIELLNDKNVFTLLQKLGAEPIDKGNYILSKTICHNIDATDASYKLYYYKNSHIFQCYSECGSLSIFTFLKHYYEARGIDYDWYHDVYQVILDCSNFQYNGFKPPVYESLKDKYDISKKEIELPEYPSGCLDVFTKTYPGEWLDDGISKEAMDKFNILYSISQNKIIIPHYDIKNRLVGIRGRALDQ